jgi:hypothetical protein
MPASGKKYAKGRGRLGWEEASVALKLYFDIRIRPWRMVDKVMIEIYKAE